MARQACEGRIELGFATCAYDLHLPVDATSGGVHIFRLDLSRRIGWIQQHTNDGRVGDQLMQKLQAFCFH